MTGIGDILFRNKTKVTKRYKHSINILTYMNVFR